MRYYNTPVLRPGTIPGASDIVIIGALDSIYLATTNTIPNTDVRSCASLKIEKGSALDIGYNPASSFGMVLSSAIGNGNFRLTTSWLIKVHLPFLPVTFQILM